MEHYLGYALVLFICIFLLLGGLIFLMLFKKGALVQNIFAFGFLQFFTIIHTVLRFTTGGTVGKVVGVIFALSAIGAVYIKSKKGCLIADIPNDFLARIISVILIVLSFLNTWII